MNSERLKDFRQAAYELLVLAKDATFELMDAVMTTRNAACLAEFSRASAIQSSMVKRL
ncbi:hypothetical protein [Microcoleus sp. B3-A4]|uniref:hypothetical protein n=1 Tax=Microcoleus sp. B3-A4 TaxID=2818653 RepID=UPI002FD13B6E